MRSKYVLLSVLVLALLLTASITHAARIITKNPYVVATRDIACGTRITAEDVTMYTPYRRGDYIPFAGLDTTSDVIGKYVDLNLVEGNAILTMFLHDSPETMRYCKPKS
jgi:flagella basal body P-ring formation protein FlgA